MGRISKRATKDERPMIERGSLPVVVDQMLDKREAEIEDLKKKLADCEAHLKKIKEVAGKNYDTDEEWVDAVFDAVFENKVD